VTRHQYGISALVTQTSFFEGSSGDLAKRRLFFQANKVGDVCENQMPFSFRCVELARVLYNLRPPQARNHCCGNIVEETCFPKCFPVCARTKHLLRKHFFQKHFVSGTNVSRFCCEETVLTGFCGRVGCIS